MKFSSVSLVSKMSLQQCHCGNNIQVSNCCYSILSPPAGNILDCAVQYLKLSPWGGINHISLYMAFFRVVDSIIPILFIHSISWLWCTSIIYIYIIHTRKISKTDFVLQLRSNKFIVLTQVQSFPVGLHCYICTKQFAYA